MRHVIILDVSLDTDHDLNLYLGVVPTDNKRSLFYWGISTKRSHDLNLSLILGLSLGPDHDLTNMLCDPSFVDYSRSLIKSILVYITKPFSNLLSATFCHLKAARSSLFVLSLG
jgi:hypothetical protein